MTAHRGGSEPPCNPPGERGGPEPPCDPPVPDRFRAFVAERIGDEVRREVRELSADDLPEGEVVVRVSHSSVNYKDGLATVSDSKVARISPLVPGIDLAGEIVSGAVAGAGPGDNVLVSGFDLGTAHHGGYAEYARVPAGWVVPLPDTLSARDAMLIGTAGFAAALGLHLLTEQGLRPDDGPVLVTGASGGVGSTSVALLAGLGYEVVASTGSADAVEWLRGLGATTVVDRTETGSPSSRPLEKQRWAGAIDAVGGPTLSFVLSTLRIGAGVAACGNVAGVELDTTVLPFILRGVALLGVDTAHTPIELRRELWQRLAGEWRPEALGDLLAREAALDEVEGALDAILAGDVRGRVVVDLSA